jgi:class 3 adenylate cyclase
MTPQQADQVMIWLLALDTLAIAAGIWIAAIMLRRTGNGKILRLEDIGRLGVRTEKDKEKFLAYYSALELALKSRVRSCTFLSVDIVGSRELKTDSRAAAAEATFAAYGHWVKRTLAKHGVWKQTWTPDGLMAAFNTVDEAVRSAKHLIAELGYFNKDLSSLNRPVEIRCGIAYGKVSIFEDSSLEKLSDPSIDLAGHLQKMAPRNSVLIGTIALLYLTDKEGFEVSRINVDGVMPHQWGGSEGELEEESI